MHIFIDCIPSKEYPWDHTPVSSTRNEAPLSLCHVCSSWRRIALQTPGLWTSLVMEVSPEDTMVVPERHSQVTSFWFSQAGHYLVDLEIGIKDQIVSNERFSTKFMIQLVLPRAKRIRSLHLSFDTLDEILYFLQYQDDNHHDHVWSFPNLEYLTLDLVTGRSVGTDMLTALQFLPKLHTVEIRPVIMYRQLDIRLPWSQLTSLTIQELPEAPFRVLMTQCLTLETGYFSIDVRSDNNLPTVEVTLERWQV